MSASDPKLVGPCGEAEGMLWEIAAVIEPKGDGENTFVGTILQAVMAVQDERDALASALEAADARIAALTEAKATVEAEADHYRRKFEEASNRLAHNNEVKGDLHARIASLEAENGALREKVERAAEDERDRLFEKAQRHSYGMPAPQRHDACGAAKWLRDEEGAMLPSARAALRQAEEKSDG